VCSGNGTLRELTFYFYVIANIDSLLAVAIGQEELALEILYPEYRLVGTVGGLKRGPVGGGTWILYDIEMCTVPDDK
jgi:hypothetical protein